MPHRVVRLDLGSGNVCPPGFIGVDRFPLPGVDVVADLDKPLPFADDSVDLVLASHALEHVADLMATMKEIYRVCKHGAQVCITAPYYQQGLNLANPYHLQVFNEHTPRFWTSSFDTPVDPSEYAHPHASGWGLGESDNSELDIDFRCVRMEFFHFPEYRSLSQEEQRSARKKYFDVCDEVMYHLLVVKQPFDEVMMKETVKKTSFYEPIRVALRSELEENEQLRRLFSDGEAELRKIRSVHEVELAQIRSAHAADLEQMRSAHAADLEQMRSAHKNELSGVRHVLSLQESQVLRVLRKAQRLALELGARRQGPLTRLRRRLFPDDLSGNVAPGYLPLKDDSLMAQESPRLSPPGER